MNINDVTRYELVLTDSARDYLARAFGHALGMSEEAFNRWYIPDVPFSEIKKEIRELLRKTDAACDNRSRRYEKCGFRCFTRKDILSALVRYIAEGDAEFAEWEETTLEFDQNRYVAEGRTIGYRKCADDLRRFTALLEDEVSDYAGGAEKFLPDNSADFRRYGVTLTCREVELTGRVARMYGPYDKSECQGMGHAIEKFILNQCDAVQYREFSKKRCPEVSEYGLRCREDVISELIKKELAYEDEAESKRVDSFACLNENRYKEGGRLLGEAFAMADFASELDIRFTQAVMEDVEYVGRTSKSELSER